MIVKQDHSNEKTALIEGAEIINDNKKTTKVFNTFFSYIKKYVEIPKYSPNERFYADTSDPVLKAIVKCQKHSSIVTIKQKCCFNFHHVKILNKSKAFQDIDIPTKITKENSGIFSDFLTSNFNKCNVNSIFPALLKLANMSPAHKERCKILQRYYRPVSIL